MLKGINPLLHASVLTILAEMGHGDELAIVDANFPATSMAKRTAYMSTSADSALESILTLLPLDDFVDDPATVMEMVGAPDELPEAVRDFQSALNEAEERIVKLAKIDRFAFYERAKSAFAVVATSETRLYGCILLKKGVIRPR